MPVCWAKAAAARPVKARASRVFLNMVFSSLERLSLAAQQFPARWQSVCSAPDPVERGHDAALEQRPVEAERDGAVATVDQGVGLLGGAGDATDRHAASED